MDSSTGIKQKFKERHPILNTFLVCLPISMFLTLLSLFLMNPALDTSHENWHHIQAANSTAKLVFEDTATYFTLLENDSQKRLPDGLYIGSFNDTFIEERPAHKNGTPEEFTAFLAWMLQSPYPSGKEKKEYFAVRIRWGNPVYALESASPWLGNTENALEIAAYLDSLTYEKQGDWYHADTTDYEPVCGMIGYNTAVGCYPFNFSSYPENMRPDDLNAPDIYVYNTANTRKTVVLQEQSALLITCLLIFLSIYVRLILLGLGVIALTRFIKRKIK